MNHKPDRRDYKLMAQEFKQALWSSWGLLAYFWLLIAVIDFAQHHIGTGFTDLYIVLLTCLIALLSRLVDKYSKLLDELFTVAKEQHEAISEAEPLLDDILKIIKNKNKKD